MPPKTIKVDYLKGLNTAQREAVQHPPHIPLQILAGPGSGKTKVLTSRIAHLVTTHGIAPESICAVTFTNKAANEMRERLEKLVGKHVTGQIKMGTFHSICATFLRKHATLIGIGTNFTVCDADESKRIITKLLKPYLDYLEDRNVTLKETTILSRISKAKAKGLAPNDLMDGKSKISVLKHDKSDMLQPSEVIANIVAEVYQQYQKNLKRSNSLDFDDLLVYGVKLFGDHRKVGKWCRHVLVDEFQDTNTVQYELMSHIAHASRCLSVVGDPDQSIYGWRSAEVENLSRMQKDFPTTRQIFLEQNYRSTGAILATSVAIISQDKSRIAKTLHTSHSNGPKPVLHSFPNEQAEASSITNEIKRIIAHSGGMLSYSDVAILLRMNSMSRAIESALQLEGIPHAVLGGHRFFERTEVKDLVAYLQAVDNPQYAPAFVRVVNVPSRAIGEKTITEILVRANKLQLSPLEVVERIHDGSMPDIKPPVKKKVAPFVETVRALRKMATERENPGNIVKRLIELTEYQEHLKKHHDDWESRWDNVEELVNFASEFECTASSSPAPHAQKNGADPDGDDWMDSVEDVDAFDESGIPSAGTDSDTPLRAFLQASMLATDTESGKDDSAQKDRVTLATCHAAKGLEWPVVFIPAVEKGVFPSSRAEDIEEERRLLYVACTRAQGLLYMSHCTSRMSAGVHKNSVLSEFLTALSAEEMLLRDHIASATTEDWNVIATVLSRPVPSGEDFTRGLHEHSVRSKPTEWSFDTPDLEDASSHSRTFSGRNRYRSRSPSQGPRAIPNQPFATFTSARNSVPAAYFKASSVHQANTLGPSRSGANPSRASTLAAASAKAQNAHEAMRGGIGSYLKPCSDKAASGNQPIRRIKREPSTAMPDVSVDGEGGYSSVLPVSRAPQRTSNQNIAPAALAARPIARPKVALPARTSHALPSAPAVPAPPNQPNARIAKTVQNDAGLAMAPPKVTGKRRLGMTGSFVPYNNKKFKPPTK